MGVDYYNILKVHRNATEDDLRKSYKRLAMIWHPDKNPATRRPEAESKFKRISEAYDVLSDPAKRQIYDLHGEEALKSGHHFHPPPPPPPTQGRFRHQASSAGATPSSSSSAAAFRDADDIYAEIFGSEGGRSKSRGRSASRGRTGAGGGGGGGVRAAETAAAVENMLPCSLEELCKGVKKKMKISRIVHDSFRKSRTVEEILTIEIKPGWKKGTKITFPEKGNQEPGVAPADLIFVVDEKPHAIFKRDGNDLVLNQEITLLEALTGKTLDLQTLDGRNLMIQLNEIIKPGSEKIISNEGMPISKEPGKRGNLRIKFDVRYPSRLSTEQKADLRRVLGGVS